MVASVPSFSSASQRSHRACCAQPPRSTSSRWNTDSAASCDTPSASAAHRVARAGVSGAAATSAAKPASPASSGVRSWVAHSRQATKAERPGAGVHSAWPRSKCPAAQSPMARAITPGQSIPEALAARSATLGSATGAGPSAPRDCLSAARLAGRNGSVQASQASARSASVIRPEASRAAKSARVGVSRIPATRPRRAAAMVRSSPVWPRKGLTATVASSGKAGGTAPAAASAARSKPAASGAEVGSLVWVILALRRVNGVSRRGSRRSAGRGRH